MEEMENYRNSSIWVCIYGGVMGFPPEEIKAMETEYIQLPAETRDYWSFFNWYFSDDTAGV